MDRQAWDEAIADYTAALKLDPKDDYSLQNRGRAHLGKGAWDAALADFDAALKLKPNKSGPLNYRATAYLRKGNLDRALADADDAVRIRPRLPLGARDPRRNPRRQGRPRRRARRLRGGAEAVADARHGDRGARQDPGGARACGRRVGQGHVGRGAARARGDRHTGRRGSRLRLRSGARDGQPRSPSWSGVSAEMLETEPPATRLFPFGPRPGSRPTRRHSATASGPSTAPRARAFALS